MSVQRTVFGPSYPAIFSQKRPHILSVGWNIVKNAWMTEKRENGSAMGQTFHKTIFVCHSKFNECHSSLIFFPLNLQRQP